MKNKLENVTDIELQEALNTSKSYHDLIKKFNLAINGTSYELVKKEIKRRKLNTTQFDKLCQLHSQSDDYSFEDVFCKDSPVSNIKKYIIKYKAKDISKCEICGISEWMGMPIIIQIHHKDGNHHNNEPNNLQALCPNCHSQTQNFCSKNIKKPIEFKENISKKCIDCGNSVFGDNIRCSSCYLKWEEKIFRIPKKKQLNKYVANGIDIKEIANLCSINEDDVIFQLKKYDLLNKYYNNKRIKKEKEELKILKQQEKAQREEKKQKRILEKETKPKILFNGNQKGLVTQEEVNAFRQELKEKIRNIPFLQIGKEYNVTDNAIRKWCKHLNLPYRRQDINKISNEDWEKI